MVSLGRTCMALFAVLIGCAPVGEEQALCRAGAACEEGRSAGTLHTRDGDIELTPDAFVLGGHEVLDNDAFARGVMADIEIDKPAPDDGEPGFDSEPAYEAATPHR